MQRRNLVRILLALMILLMWMLLPIQAQSETPAPLDQVWQEISSQIQPDTYYEGSLVKDVIWELILAADKAIVQAADDAAKAAAAEAIRQIKPELDGWKARAEEAEKQLRHDRWVTIGVGGGALLLGFLVGHLAP